MFARLTDSLIKTMAEIMGCQTEINLSKLMATKAVFGVVLSLPLHCPTEAISCDIRKTPGDIHMIRNFPTSNHRATGMQTLTVS